jgi:hypothetical protein
MKTKKLTEFTQEQLLQEEKKRKGLFTVYCFMMGIMIGTAIYTTIVKGYGFFTFFPLFFVPIFAFMYANYKAVQKEIKSRKY